eukprot:jgi/Bigna1/138706/aug1.46_g13414
MIKRHQQLGSKPGNPLRSNKGKQQQQQQQPPGLLVPRRRRRRRGAEEARVIRIVEYLSACLGIRLGSVNDEKNMQQQQQQQQQQQHKQHPHDVKRYIAGRGKQRPPHQLAHQLLHLSEVVVHEEAERLKIQVKNDEELLTPSGQSVSRMCRLMELKNPDSWSPEEHVKRFERQRGRRMTVRERKKNLKLVYRTLLPLRKKQLALREPTELQLLLRRSSEMIFSRLLSATGIDVGKRCWRKLGETKYSDTALQKVLRIVPSKDLIPGKFLRARARVKALPALERRQIFRALRDWTNSSNREEGLGARTSRSSSSGSSSRKGRLLLQDWRFLSNLEELLTRRVGDPDALGYGTLRKLMPPLIKLAGAAVGVAAPTHRSPSSLSSSSPSPFFDADLEVLRILRILAAGAGEDNSTAGATSSCSSARAANLSRKILQLLRRELLEAREKLRIKAADIKSLPPSIGFMQGLRHVDLSDNRLTSFPASFYTLPRLESIDVSGNYITGLISGTGTGIDNRGSNCSDSSGKSSSASSTKLTNRKKPLCRNEDLKTTRKQDAAAASPSCPPPPTPTPPTQDPADGSGDNNDSNRSSSSSSGSACWALSLLSLNLSDNEFATVPRMLRSLSKLQRLDLSFNAIAEVTEGAFDGEGLGALEWLDLSYNVIRKLPERFPDLPSLEFLRLSGNFIDSLPASISDLKALRKLDISGNRLRELPDEIGGLHRLHFLDVSSNNLEEIPETIVHCRRLEILDVSGNEVQSLPTCVGRCRSLKILRAQRNHLKELYHNITDLTWLQELDVSDNYISQLPSTIGKLTGLKSLTLAKNELKSLPPYIGNLRFLEKLDLYANQLEELPDEIGFLTELRHLELYHNCLRALPNRIGELQKLEILCLEGNRISFLPNEIGRLKSLTVLELHMNKLVKVPRKIGRLSNLKKLVLRVNELTFLPKEMGSLAKLEELDLAKNLLEDVPSELKHLKSLTRLEITGNPFLTTWPEELRKRVIESRM